MGVWTQLREARPSFFLLRHPLSNRSPRSVLSLLSNEQGDIITLRGMEVLGAWRSLWRSAPRRFECSACLFCFLIERARRRQPTTENERGTDPFRAMSADAAVGVNTVVNYSEMNESDQAQAIEIALNALKTQEKTERPVYHKDIAQIVKQQLDAAKGGTWHVVVGSSFGCFVSNETKTMIHFQVGNVSFLIWRHG